MAVYDPFGQGYMHDWRLEEAVKEGVRRAFSQRNSSLDEEKLHRALRALAMQAEMNREDAEFLQSLRALYRESLRRKKRFDW